jgi:hypothetical protein
MRIGQTLLCFLLWLSLRAAAMNDTDGLYGVGIFPISRTGEASTLVIEREWVDIRLGRDGRAVSLAFRNGLVSDPDFGGVFQKIERPRVWRS